MLLLPFLLLLFLLTLRLKAQLSVNVPYSFEGNNDRYSTAKFQFNFPSLANELHGNLGALEQLNFSINLVRTELLWRFY